MHRRMIALIAMWSLLALAASAQDAEPVAAPEPRDVELLETVPGYGQILSDQWSDGVGADVTETQTSADHYGLLTDEGATALLSLPESVALALANNTDLRIQRLGPVAATAEVRNARSVFDPQLFADLAWNRSSDPATTILTSGGFPLGGGGAGEPGGEPADLRLQQIYNQGFAFNAGIRKTMISGGLLSLQWDNSRLSANPSIVNPLIPRYDTALGLSLNQPLLRDFGWRYTLLLVEVAQTAEQAAFHQYKAGLAEIIVAVESAYWSLVAAIEAVRVQEQSLALAQELERQNEGKYNVGTLPQTAVLEAQTEVASREATLIRALNLRDNARDRLRAVINSRDPETGKLLMIAPSDKPDITPYPIDLQKSLQNALDSRPELVAARLDVQGRGLERKVAQNQLLPRLNFIGEIGLKGVSGTDTGVTQVAPGLDGSYDQALKFLPDGRFYDYLVGAAIEIPINNAEAKAGFALAKINFEQSKLSLRKLEEQITLEIKEAVSNLRTDLKSIDATRIARELAEENVRNQQARYDVGLATTKDLLDFQDQLTTARFREIEALTRYNTDLAVLRRVEGTLLTARNVLVEPVEPEDASWWAKF
jgi:outer membrane protein TolC